LDFERPLFVLTLIPQGDKLRSFRVALGYSQEELAARAGVSDRTVRNAEKSRPLRREFLDFIAQALGVSLELLVEPSHELLIHRRWQRNVDRLTATLGELVANHDATRLMDLIQPKIELNCVGENCYLPVFAAHYGAYRGAAGVARYIESGRRLFDLCDVVEFQITPPQGGGDVIMFRSHDRYQTHSGRSFFTDIVHVVEYDHERIARLSQFHTFVPIAD
jgi:transcriptional regulator with XRE-family HTH domain